MAVLTACGAFGSAVATPAQGTSGPATAQALAGVAAMDREYGGAGTIIGTTKVQPSVGAAVVIGHCPVRLHLRINSQVARSTVSDADGNYAFPYLDPTLEFYAVALHPTRSYNLAPADNLFPEILT